MPSRADLPPPTPAEVAAFEAQNALLRNKLGHGNMTAAQMMATVSVQGAESGETITISEVGRAPARRSNKPTPTTGRLRAPVRQAKTEIRPETAPVAPPPAPAPDPEAAARAAAAAELRRQPKYRVAMALMGMLDSTLMQAQAMNPDEPMERTLQDVAIEGNILCALTRMMTGQAPDDQLEDQAADAIVIIMHAMAQSGVREEDITGVLNMANANYAADVRQAELATINVIQTRSAPAWAWELIDETLDMDSRSKAFDPELRARIGNAFTAMQVATEQPELMELAEDDLVPEAEEADDALSGDPNNPFADGDVFQGEATELEQPQ